jgi:hypothetical protein
MGIDCSFMCVYIHVGGGSLGLEVLVVLCHFGGHIKKMFHYCVCVVCALQSYGMGIYYMFIILVIPYLK